MYIEDLFLFLAILLTTVFSVVAYIKCKRNKEIDKLQERICQAGIKEIDKMDGIGFELYLAELFKQFGYQVRRTPSSNDFGADLILEGSERFVVQAKRYKKKVGIKTVQEIHAAKLYYKAEGAWVITNNYFTKQAIDLASSTNITLIDRDELANMILLISEPTSINIK